MKELLIYLLNNLQNKNILNIYIFMTKNDACKCVDYYREKDGNIYVKQKIINKKPIEIKCNKKVENGKHFCKAHRNCKTFLRKFTSGYEPEYNPDQWAHPYIEGSHNCYAYFLNDIMTSLKKKCEEICHKEGGTCPSKHRKCRSLIPQPGDYDLYKKYGNLDKKTYDYNCEEMDDKILRDNPTIQKTELTEKCPQNMYKGAMVTDPGSTFHFYRQNKDGTWSHKPGTLRVTDKDADGNPIYSPYTANRDYSDGDRKDPINYTGFCGYYCIPTEEKYKTRAK